MKQQLRRSKSEVRLESAAAKLVAAALVVIAHRLSTVQNADKLLLSTMASLKLRYDQLMETCPF